MPSGIAMSTANKASTQQPIQASVATRDEGPFKCDGCGTPVSFVQAHIRYHGDPERERRIDAFFRLGTHKPPTSHDKDCRYTVGGQVGALVAASEAVEVHLRPFTFSDGKQVFRLAMLKEAEKRVPYTPDNAEYRKRIEEITSSRELSQYFRSAVGLAKLWVLLGKIGGRRELSDLISIKMKGTTVPWKNFFFEAEEAPRLAGILKAKPPEHPTTLVVHIREIQALKNGSTVARCSAVAVPEAESPTFVGPSVFGSADIMQGLEIGRHYLVVANWRSRGSEERPSWQKDQPPRTFHNISANIYQSAQFAEVNPPEEEGVQLG